jgi:hypothetical protein
VVRTASNMGFLAAERTSETSVDNHFTWQYIPEDKSEHLYFLSFAPHTTQTFHSEEKWCKFQACY